MKKTCPHCLEVIKLKDNFCPFCGRPTQETPPILRDLKNKPNEKDMEAVN